MSLEQIKTVVRRFNDEFVSQNNLDSFKQVMALDIVDHNAIPSFPAGAAGVRQLFDVYRMAFPDLRAEVHDQIAEGDKVATRKTFHGTHLGPLMGIPPTGKKVAINVIDIVRVVNGQITEHWNVVDQLGLLQQLGVAPQPA
jgi:steroid delta-isomerase-like uncharacterized protein